MPSDNTALDTRYRRVGLILVTVAAAVAFMLATPERVYADTIYVNGTISSDETWTSGNVYVVNGDLTTGGYSASHRTETMNRKGPFNPHSKWLYIIARLAQIYRLIQGGKKRVEAFTGNIGNRAYLCIFEKSSRQELANID